MGWGVKRLNGMDAMLLYSETPNLHTHTLKVAIIHAADFDGEFTFDVFRRTIQRRLHLLDPLRYQLVDIPWKLHHPMWMENCPVDLDYHLRRVRVPTPGGRRELDEVIGRIASTPLDRSRPLWEFHFAEGMADDRFALIGKVHHTLADGVASANLLARLMDLAGSAQDERDDYVMCDPPSKGQLLWEAQLDHFQNMAALPRLISDAARGFARVRKRNKEWRDHPDLARMFRRRRLFSTTWSRRCEHSRRPHCLWPRSRRPPSISASRSTTWCWRWRRAGYGSCCCATTVVLIDR